MEHPRAVVFHLRLDEVKVPRLLVRYAHVHLPAVSPVSGDRVWPASDGGHVNNLITRADTKRLSNVTNIKTFIEEIFFIVNCGLNCNR